MKTDSLVGGLHTSKVIVSSVLVVDSSIEDANALVRLIRQHKGNSVRVLTAPSILDGLRAFRHEKPVCVLVEHRLADGDGVEFLRMLTEITSPLPAPLIYLAANDSPRLAVRVLKAGAQDFLSKAWVDSESLFRSIESVVERTEAAKVRIQQRLDIEETNRALHNQLASQRAVDELNQRLTGRAPVFLYLNEYPHGRSIYVNQTLLRTLGYSELEWSAIAGAGWRELINSEDVGAYDHQVRQVLQSNDGDIVEGDYRLRKKDGSYLRVATRETPFSRDSSGGVTQVIGTAEEVGDKALLFDSLKEEASALSGQVRDLQTIWDQNQIGLAFSLGAKPSVIRINPVLARWLQLTESTDLLLLARAFGFTPSSSSFGKALAKGQSSHQAERSVHLEDGSTLKLLETVLPLRDQEGDTSGFVAYFVEAPNRSGSTGTRSVEESSITLDELRKQVSSLQDKLEQAELRRSELESQLQLSEDVATRLQNLVDEQSTENTSRKTHEGPEQAGARARAAEDRLSELDTRWRESVSLLLSADQTRESLTAEIESLKAELLRKSKDFENRERALQEVVNARLAALEKAESKLHETTNQIEEARSEAMKVEAALVEKEAEARQYRQLILDLQSQLDYHADAESSLKELRRELQASNEARRLLEKLIREARADCSELESARNELEQRLARSDDERELSEAQLKDAIRQASDSAQTVARLRQDQESSNGLISRLELRLSEVGEREKLKVESLESEKLALARSLELTEASVAALTLQVANLSEISEAQRSAMEKELSGRQELLSNLAELQTQLDRLQAKLHEGEQRWWKTYKEAEQKDRLISDLSESRQLLEADASKRIAWIEKLHLSLQEVNLQLEVAKKSEPENSEQMREAHDQIAKLRHSLEENATSGVKKDEEIAALKSLLYDKTVEAAKASHELALAREQLEDYRHGLEFSESEILELEQQLASGLSRNEQLTSELATATSNLMQVRTRANENQRELDQLRVEVGNLKVRQREQDSEIESLRKSIKDSSEEFQNQLEAAGLQLDEARKSLCLTETERDLMRSRSEAIELELQEAKATNTELSNQCLEDRNTSSSLAVSLSTSRQELDQVNQERESLRQELSQTQAGLTALSHAHRSLQSAATDHSLQFERLAKALEEAQSALEKSERERALAIVQLSEGQTEVQSRLESLEEQFTAKKNEAAHLQVQLEDSAQALARAVSENEALQSTLASRQQSLIEASHKVKELETELTNSRGSLELLRQELHFAEGRATKATLDYEGLKLKLLEADETLWAEREKVSDRTEEIAELRRSVSQAEDAIREGQIKVQQVELSLLAANDKVKLLSAEAKYRQEELETTKTQLLKAQQDFEASEQERTRTLEKLFEITGQVTKALNELRLAEERYRALANTMPCIVFTATSLGIVDYVNDRWEEFTGLSMESAMEGSWKDVLHKDDLGTFMRTWTESIRSGEPMSLTLRLKRKDGQFRWHTFRCSTEQEENRILRWMGIITEIHEQVSSREAARQARLRYGALLDNTNESIVFLSTGGYVLGASKASLRLLKQGAEGVVGTPFWETKWWPKAEVAKLEDAVKRAATGTRCEVDCFRFDYDRQHRPSKVVVVPVKDENDQIAMLVSHFADNGTV